MNEDLSKLIRRMKKIDPSLVKVTSLINLGYSLSNSHWGRIPSQQEGLPQGP